jgi:diguanylate cyclase (GGDEF)-like protein/PAS domain S-box-containing protein
VPADNVSLPFRAALAEWEGRETLLRTVITNAPLILFAFDLDGVVTLSEGRALRDLGQMQGESVGCSIDELYADQPALLTACRHALAGEAVSLTITVRGRSFDTHYTPMRDASGAVSGVIGVSTDVTERVRSEEALRESTERFQSSFELSAIGEGIVSLEGRWLQVNGALCTMLGYSEEELLSLSFQDITHPEDLNNDLTHLSQMLAGTVRTYQIEKRYFHKRGHLLWITLNVALVHDAQGAPLYIISQIQDMTARKLAEDEMRRQQERLQESEAQFRLLFANNPHPMWVLELGTLKFLEVNEAAIARYGYSREEFLSMRLTEIRPPEFESQLFDHLAVLHGQSRLRDQARHRTKDGQFIDVEIAGHALEFDGRKTMLVLVQDITERKAAQEALLQQAAMLQEQAELLDLAHDAIVVRQGGTAAIQFWNRGADRMYGFTREEALGESAHTLLHTVFPQPIEEIEAIVRDTGYWEGELIHTARDGRRLTVASRWALQRSESGEPGAVLEINNDITERKRAEEHLEALLAERTATLQVVEYRALHDDLTDLANRTLIYDRLDHAIQAAHREQSHFALLFLDLDRFKRVNDTLGHRIGDLLLQEVARRLQRTLRQSDTVARLGGDEFAILLPGSDNAGAERAAAKILEALKPSILLEEHHLDIGGSIGIALYPDHGTTAETLMQRADGAMYVAKRDRTGFGSYRPEGL